MFSWSGAKDFGPKKQTALMNNVQEQRDKLNAEEILQLSSKCFKICAIDNGKLKRDSWWTDGDVNVSVGKITF